MLLFYDFEVFKYDWLCVIFDLENSKVYEFNNKNRNGFISFYSKHDESIWVGYNSRGYDQFILRAILLDFNPYEVNDWIINQGKNGWEYSSLFFKVQLYNFDVQFGYNGLKTLEGFMGNSIEETEVPWDLKRPLSPSEYDEVLSYCKYDVFQTVEVFMQKKEQFETSMSLIKIFNLDIKHISKTHSGLVAHILGARGRKFDDEFELEIVPTLKLKKYRTVLEWFEYQFVDEHDYKEKLEIKVAGVPTTFAFGGIHGSLERYHAKGHFLLIDVTAYYPSLQLLYKFGYRNMSRPNNFELIHNENLRLKKKGDKIARQPFKIADNSISGQLKDPYSKLYDPKYNNAICVNGQLLMLDLIEKLEGKCKMIVYNTDGIIVKLHKISDFEKIDDIVYEFEKRTGLSFDFEHYKEVWIKDCNNYVLIDENRKPKTIGAYVKKLSPLDYDMPIVNKALVNYMVNKVPIEKTINECDDLIEFQIIFKLSYKYLRAWHNGQYRHEKTFRVFASKAFADTPLKKQKALGETDEKFAGSPEHCFIDNGNIVGKKVPSKLDKNFYIDLANKRLKDFML